MWCPWSWWKLQYLFLSLFFTGVLIGFGHCREGSSLICIKTCSIGIIRAVKLVNFSFLSRTSFFFPMVCPTLSVSFFLSWLLLVPLSLFLFHFISFQALHLLHSCTSEPFGAIPRLFLVGFWWLRRKTPRVATLPGKLLGWLDLQFSLLVAAPY